MAVRPQKHRDMGCEYHYSYTYINKTVMCVSTHITVIDITTPSYPS